MFSWLHFFTYALVTAITPGPNNIMSMSNAGRLGFRRALPFNFGIWAGFTAVMLICTLCCSLLSSLLPKIKLPMLIVGAAYLLYLAWKTFRSDSLPEAAAHSGFLSGLALQFINPKIYIYGIVSMEAYILPYYEENPMMLFLFSVLLALIGFLCTLCWALFGSGFRLLFTKHARVTNSVMALLLVYCAVALFF